jgi:hypothetical protein
MRRQCFKERERERGHTHTHTRKKESAARRGVCLLFSLPALSFVLRHTSRRGTCPTCTCNNNSIEKEENQREKERCSEAALAVLFNTCLGGLRIPILHESSARRECLRGDAPRSEPPAHRPIHTRGRGGRDEKRSRKKDNPPPSPLPPRTCDTPRASLNTYECSAASSAMVSAHACRSCASCRSQKLKVSISTRAASLSSSATVVTRVRISCTHSNAS